jgi:hypothetical protein
MSTIQTLNHVFNNDTLVVDAKLGEILGSNETKEGRTKPFMPMKKFFHSMTQGIIKTFLTINLRKYLAQLLI